MASPTRTSPAGEAISAPPPVPVVAPVGVPDVPDVPEVPDVSEVPEVPDEPAAKAAAGVASTKPPDSNIAANKRFLDIVMPPKSAWLDPVCLGIADGIYAPCSAAVAGEAIPPPWKPRNTPTKNGPLAGRLQLSPRACRAFRLLPTTSLKSLRRQRASQGNHNSQPGHAEEEPVAPVTLVREVDLVAARAHDHAY